MNVCTSFLGNIYVYIYFATEWQKNLKMSGYFHEESVVYC